MKFKFTFVITLLWFFSFSLFGQDKIYLGFEVGPKYENYQNDDNGDGLTTPPFVNSPVFGITLGNEFGEKLIIESGVHFVDYSESYRIRGDLGYSTSNAIFFFQIPLRLKYKIHVITESLSISPHVGIHAGINPAFAEDDIGSGFSFGTNSSPMYNDSTRTEEISFYNFRRVFALVEAGISFEYKNPNGSIFYLSGNLFKGWKRIVQLDVTYRINDEPSQQAKVYSNGDYYSLVIGYKYPISNIWKKNKVKDLD